MPFVNYNEISIYYIRSSRTVVRPIFIAYALHGDGGLLSRASHVVPRTRYGFGYVVFLKYRQEA